MTQPDAGASKLPAKGLALFDFDGTITERDTFLEFVEFATSKARMLMGKIALSPLIVGYRLGVVPASTIRAEIARFAFTGVDVGQLRQLGEDYARERIPKLCRARAQQQLEWHRQRGDRIAVVSASLDVYLVPWCREQDLELICTQLETRDGKMTGRYVAGDCSGAEKRVRIQSRYDLREYASIHAYGDTAEDEEMLSLADTKFFQWNEVQRSPL